MTVGNGHHERLAQVEADHRDLRQLMLDEFRALRGELKDIMARLSHVDGQVRLTGEAVDTILAAMKHDEADGE